MVYHNKFIDNTFVLARSLRYLTLNGRWSTIVIVQFMVVKRYNTNNNLFDYESQAILGDQIWPLTAVTL